ncbi:hypothetical protein CK203_076389 [Vitis vinifera]|uniref:DUF4283 domain-containing protein n=1 Tax=Vitis vinifera TaxID=29760 RepID=A0A438C0G3_VITVI|nr:hypothetical protein CK203_076389 [Vitis vinifera]
MAMREKANRGGEENGRGVALGWIRRVRLGPTSVRLFLEGLDQCVKNGNEDKWEKGWKEKGRSYSMVREANRAGCFLWLGVVDSEEKRYSICIPKGKRERGGWLAMAEVLRKLIASFDKKENKKEKKTSRRLQVEMGKRLGSRDRNLVRVEGLKGKLGLARLEKEWVLLEFELVEEARRVLTSGKRSARGIQVGLEFWNPRSAKLAGDQGRGDNLSPSPLVGGFAVVQTELGGYRGSTGRSSGEVRGDGGASVGPQVEERVNARPEALSLTADGTEGQVDGAGSDLTEGWIQFGLATWFPMDWAGDGGVGPVVGPTGSKGKEKVAVVENGPPFGPSVPLRNRLGPSLTQLKAFGVQPIRPSVLLRDSHGPSEIQPTDKELSVKVCSSSQPEFCKESNFELEFISLREKEAGRKQQVDSHYSLTDCVLAGEDSRYGSLSNLGGLRDLGSTSPSISFSFSRTLEGEFYDHSGEIREVCQNGNLLSFQNAAGPIVNGNGCLELVEFNGPILVARFSEGGSA